MVYERNSPYTSFMPSNNAKHNKGNKMKTLIKLALITASMSLIACGDGVHQVSDNNAAAVTVEVQQPIIDKPVEVVNTEPSIIVCPQNSANQCGDTPYKLPNRVTVTPDNSIPCIRDNNPLVIVDGVLTDNCGNKYGSTL